MIISRRKLISYKYCSKKIFFTNLENTVIRGWDTNISKIIYSYNFNTLTIDVTFGVLFLTLIVSKKKKHIEQTSIFGVRNYTA